MTLLLGDPRRHLLNLSDLTKEEGDEGEAPANPADPGDQERFAEIKSGAEEASEDDAHAPRHLWWGERQDVDQVPARCGRGERALLTCGGVARGN